MPTFVFILIILLFSTLALIFSVECGYSLASLFPSLISKPEKNITLNGQLWKITNSLTFLLLISFLILLKNNNLNINNSVFSLFLIALIALFIKTLTRTFLRNIKKAKPNRLINYIYLLSSYLFLLCVSSVGVFLVTGKQFWVTVVGWVLFVSCFVGITLIGLSYVNRKPYLEKDINLQYLLQILFITWVLLLSFAYPISLAHFNNDLIGISLSFMEAVMFAIVFGYALSAIKQKKPYELYQYTFLAGFLVPILIAWNNRPYFLNQVIKINNILIIGGYKASYNWLVWLTLVILIVLLFVSFYLLFNLLVPKLSVKKLIKN